MKILRNLFALSMVFGTAGCSLAVAQVAEPLSIAPAEPVSGAAPAYSIATCTPWKAKIFPNKLSPGQLVCYELSPLGSPSFLFGTIALTAFSEWRNNPRMTHRDGDDPVQRFGALYARRAARAGAELMVSYLHHEDPRPRASNLQGWRRRTGAAVLSVLESPAKDGSARMAFGPIAGSLGSGFTTMTVYQHENGWSNALQRSGLVYSRYLVRAIVHEFTPELWSLAPPWARKYR